MVRPFSIRMGPMLQKSPSIERAQAQPPSLAVRSHLTAYSQNEASLGSLPETSQNSPHLATAGVLSAGNDPSLVHMSLIHFEQVSNVFAFLSM